VRGGSFGPVRRSLRIAIQVAVSGGVLAILLWQVDLGRTVDLVRSSDGAYFAAALAVFVAPTWLMAWRWQLLLRSKGIDEPLGWLTRLYFVGYAASQVLPTSMGGDAVRIVEHARRRPRAKAEVAGAVLIERVIGATGTLVLVALGLAVAVGRYEDIELLVWAELIGVAAIGALLVLMFSRRTRGLLQARVFPLGRRLRLQQPIESVHTALHGYREHKEVLAAALVLTVVTQLARTASIWLCGEAVGLDLSPLVYLILGPLLFFVVLMPFTINGLGVREAFFVAFLSRFGIDADAAFATGFLYYAATVLCALPGAALLLWRGKHEPSPRFPPGDPPVQHPLRRA
jgi:glycosyltransferase 2 family protein